MKTKNVTAGSVNKIKYRVPLGKDDCFKYITCLGDGRVGVVYYNGYRYILAIVRIQDGSVLWQQGGYDTFGGVAVPLYDERAVYMPMNNGSQNMAAYDRETGKELWTRYLGNGQYNFMVPPVQTAAHVAAVSVNSDRLSVIDKKSGKLAGKVKMPHGLEDYWPLLRPWRDKFVAVAVDGKNDQWTIDLYDPAAEGLFVDTLFRFPEKKGDDGKIRLQEIVGDSLYFFTEEGLFCKLDLLSGKVSEKHILPDASHSEYGWDYTGRYIHRYDGRLGAIGTFYTEEDDTRHYFALRYDLESGAFSAIPISEPKTGHLQFYKDGAYRLSKKGLERWDVFGDGNMTEIAFEQWNADIADRTFDNSGESGEQWLIAEDRLLAVQEAKDGEDSGRLLCWEL